MRHVLNLCCAAIFCLGLSHGRCESQQLPGDALAKIKENFRAGRNEPKRRIGAIDQAAKLGADAVRELTRMLDDELGPEMNAYREKVAQLAQKIAEARRKAAGPDEIKKLRGQILALVEDDALSEERIKAVADPAIQRLKDLLLFDRTALAKQIAGMKQRKFLLFHAPVWSKCRLALAQCAAKEKKSDEVISTPLTLQDHLAQLEDAAVLAAISGPEAAEVCHANAKLVGSLDVEELENIVLLNQLRMLLGLKLLTIEAALTQAARGHSKDMQTLKFFSHDSPVSGKRTLMDRARLAGTTASAENIYHRSESGDDALKSWWYSPGHFKNMLRERHSRVGVGRFKDHWTQLFGN
jgi:uncharacterized protein YkwD